MVFNTYEYIEFQHLVRSRDGFNGLVHISSWWMLVIYWPQFPRDSGRWSIIWLQSSNFNEFNTKTVDNLEWSLTMTWIMYTIPVCTARVYSICFKQPEYPNHAYVIEYHHGICNMFVPIIIYVHAFQHTRFPRVKDRGSRERNTQVKVVKWRKSSNDMSHCIASL